MSLAAAAEPMMLHAQERARIVVPICAAAEWSPAKEALQPGRLEPSPYGEFFRHDVAGEGIVFLHGGWGKIAAAASTEYAIATWQPQLLVNLGTCGGIEGRVEIGDTLLATRTVTYDIGEAMGDSADAVRHYTTDIDVRWVDGMFPINVRRALLVSADRDLIPSETGDVVRRYGAVAADLESSAIAYVAQRRQVPALILRGVSDLVSPRGGEAIGNLEYFQKQAAAIMRRLVADLPELIGFVLPRLPSHR